MRAATSKMVLRSTAIKVTYKLTVYVCQCDQWLPDFSCKTLVLQLKSDNQNGKRRQLKLYYVHTKCICGNLILLLKIKLLRSVQTCKKC